MATPLSRRKFVQLAAAAPLASTSVGAAFATEPRKAARSAMRRAAAFMDEQISYEGAYVWKYLPDLSLSWGEMEARRTMCWIQPPGTPTVGHSLLDAYNATGDRRFFKAAKRTGLALVRAQTSHGGWNYIHDFAGEESLRNWYETIGANGWRLEEFQHFYPNATFDDATTSTAAQLILRLYLVDRDRRFKRSLDRAIEFITRSQFNGRIGDGGWPQRWPPYSGSVTEMPWPDALPSWLPEDARQGMEDGDYTRHVTFNDAVLGENIKFLLMCICALERHDLAGPVHRGMNCLRRLQHAAPQAGWGLQHLWEGNGRPDGAPAGGRSYEPRALTTHTTQTNIRQLFNYFQLTGDRTFLDRVPEAIAWLESCKLTQQQIDENPLLVNRTHPTYIELDTNRGLFVHRFGSNIRNGAYYYDYNHRETLSHYSGGRNIDIDNLKETYETLMAKSPEEVAELRARSPLTRGGPIPLPRYFSLRDIDLLDLLRGATFELPEVEDDDAQALIRALGEDDYWLSPADAVTNPYIGPGSTTPYDGKEYMSRHVGDLHDTSPYDSRNPPATPLYEVKDPPLVISTETFVENMGTLIAYVSR